MEPYSKKRKPNEYVSPTASTARPPPHLAAPSPLLTKDDVLRLIEPLSRDQLADIVATASSHGGSALDLVRSLCGRDPAQRKIFIRGLSLDTTQESLRSVFAPYGEIEECVLISDKATGKSKGYGFVTFRHVDGAIVALKDPSKKIDDRITVVHLASAGLSDKSASNSAQKAADLAQRKIFVGNVLPDMSSERLLLHFSTYGEIEEGPLGFDKQTGRFRGFAFFVYKNVSGAQAALANPNKVIDGQTLVCKLAGEGKKGKTGGASEPINTGQGQTGMPNSDVVMSGIALPGQYGGLSAGLSSYANSGSGLSLYGGPGTVPGISSFNSGLPLQAPLSGNLGPASGIASLNTANSLPGFGLGTAGPGTQYGNASGLGLSSGSRLIPNSAKIGMENLSTSSSALLRVNPGVGIGGGFVDGSFRGPDRQMQMGLRIPAGASARMPGRPGMYPNLPPYY